jgi:hypothetical protein
MTDGSGAVADGSRSDWTRLRKNAGPRTVGDFAAKRLRARGACVEHAIEFSQLRAWCRRDAVAWLACAEGAPFVVKLDPAAAGDR